MTAGKRVLCGLLCLSLLALSGCVGSQPQEKQAEGKTLPQVRQGPAAPSGDSQSPRDYNAVLYVPNTEGTSLTTVVRRVTVESWQTRQQALVEALLSVVDASGFNGTMQQLRLAPVSNAVETTGDLVTVNMHSSMRSLSDEAQYALRLAIVNTLTELPQTNYVSVLVYGYDIGVDVAGTIPSGVEARFMSNDVSAAWSRLQAERNSSEGELQKMAALYFVSEGGDSLLGEVRGITLTARNPASYAKLLIDELGKGPMRVEGARLLVPTLEYFERDPVLSESEDGNYIDLYFRQEIDDFLALRGSTRAMLLSSICYTLVGFIPRLEGIRAYIGGALVTELEMMDGELWSMQNGQLTRESVVTLAADTVTVYYPLASGAALRAVQRPVAQRLRSQPRTLIRELMKPPGSAALASVFPAEIGDADILALQIQGDTALLNVTAAFAEACRNMTAIEERNMVYAIVNTLTELDGVARVRFYVEGEQAELAGHLFMGGEFLRNTGLIYETLVPREQE